MTGSPRRRSQRLAFHIRNALLELEALERMPRTHEQCVALASLRRSLTLTEARADTVRRTYPQPVQTGAGA